MVWGEDRQTHDLCLKQVLDRAREYNLKLSRDKCQFRKLDIPYVGHVLTQDGLKPDPEKIRAVEGMKKPTCVKELQTLMGFIQYSVLEIRQKMNWARFLFELALFHFELALPSLNRPFKNDTFSSHFLL